MRRHIFLQYPLYGEMGLAQSDQHYTLSVHTGQMVPACLNRDFIVTFIQILEE